MNGKKLNPQDLNKLRKQAVSLRLQQYSLNQVQQLTGLSHPTIIAAFNSFRSGGWEAVKVKQRGRPTGSGSQPLDDQACIDMLLHRKPETVQASQFLWSNTLFNQWLDNNTNTKKSAKFCSRYLAQLGFCPEAKFFDSQTPREWLGKNFNELSSKHTGKNSQFLIGAIDYLKLPKQSVEATGGKATAATLLYTRDLRGKLYWLASDKGTDEDLILDFMQRLKKQFAVKQVVLFFHSYSLNRMKKIQNWLTAHKQIRLVTFNDELLKDNEITNAAKHQQVSTATQTKLLAVGNPLNQLYVRNTMALTHLQRLEAESMQIMREVVSETENPVMLYSVGKDSAVMLHLALKAFYPSKPPFALLHVDTGWKFRDMYTFRDKLVQDLGMELIIYTNPEGLEKNINPFTHGSALHTDIMKTEGLKQALDKYGFDAAFGGARRDEEKSRAKERIFSFRTPDHRWDPKNQRPELWKQYNAKKRKGESIRVFPISNWTELDVWQYIHKENIPTVPLYLAAERPVVERDGMLIMVDDERFPLKAGEVPMMKKVRFRTLGCYPLTGAIESEADTLPRVIQEMLLTKTSERQGRLIDQDSAASMEKKKQEGYF